MSLLVSSFMRSAGPVAIADNGSEGFVAVALAVVPVEFVVRFEAWL